MSNRFGGTPDATSGGAGGGVVPPGGMIPFGGLYSAIPAGWLPCDGGAYSQATYSGLYAVIGGAWDTFDGAGAPGAGLFRTPDYRARGFMGENSGSAPNGTKGTLGTRSNATAVGTEGHVHDITVGPSATINVDNDGGGSTTSVGTGTHTHSGTNNAGTIHPVGVCPVIIRT